MATGQSLGFAFVQYETEEEAKQALAKANNYRLDRSHVFKLSPLDDYHKYMAIPDEEVELKPPPYEPSENLKGWLLDEQARDQYVVRYNEETEIWWNDAVKGQQDADPAYAKRNWTDTYINWSPRGTYLATFHRRAELTANTFFKACAYHPDESQIVTTGTDRKVSWWEAFDGSAIRVVDGSETAEINSLDVSSDGTQVVTGGGDKDIKVWGYDEGACFHVGKGHSGAVTKVKFTPDGQKIVTVGSEGAIFIWQNMPLE